MTREPQPRLTVAVTGVHHIEGEQIVEITPLFGNVPPEEVDGVLDRALGPRIDPDSKRGRVLVGFAKWKSSWDPDEERRRANADLN